MTEADKPGEAIRLKVPRGTYDRYSKLGHVVLGRMPRCFSSEPFTDREKFLARVSKKPIRISQEEKCDKGGSCVDLTGFYLKEDGEPAGFHIHLTRTDEIESFQTFKIDDEKREISMRQSLSEEELRIAFSIVEERTKSR